MLFGERERAERLSGRQTAQPRVLLRIGTERSERLGDERVVDCRNHRDDRGRRGERLNRECVADVILSRPTRLSRNRHPEQPQRGGLTDQRFGKHSLFVNRRCRRVDPRRGKLADAILKLPLGVGQFEVHHAFTCRWRDQILSRQSRVTSEECSATGHELLELDTGSDWMLDTCDTGSGS